MDNNFENSEILSSYKFAAMSDVIFCGVFLKSQVNDLNLMNNIKDYFTQSEYTFIRKDKFSLKENDVIFCKTEHIEELFYLLKKQCVFKNIKIISTQSDKKITRRLYLKKPKCVSEWYSINVNYSAQDLIPIPLGIANFHSKNLNLSDFEGNNIVKKKTEDKLKKLYVNFNENTNYIERRNIFDIFENFNWAKVDRLTLSNHQYQINLSSYYFILAPWGNGIDTHRFWEALYSGSIPITKKHIIYDSFDQIPKILVNSYKDITYHDLQNYLQNNLKYKSINEIEQLKASYWEKKIKNKVIESNNIQIEILNNKKNYFYKKIQLKHNLKSKLKILNRIQRFTMKKLNF